MKICLVRHGEAVKTETDIILTKEGKKQAKHIGKRLSSLQIDRVYVSTATRAQETFQAYAQFKPQILAVHTPEIEEIYRTLVGGPPKKGTPQNRERKDKLRMESFLKKLLLLPKHENILVFTHGNVICYLIATALRLNKTGVWEKLMINPGSLSLLELHNKTLYVTMINSIEHLPKKDKEAF